MTGKTLKAKVFRFTNDELWADNVAETDTLVCDWISSALSEYPPEAFTPIEYLFTDVRASIEYPLPEDYVQSVRYIADGKEYIKSDIIVITDTNTICFPENLEAISMYYYQAPEDYVNKSEDIPLKLQFHAILYYYLLSMYYAQSGEGDNEETIMSNSFKTQYLSQKSNLLFKLDNGGVTSPIATVDAMPKRRRRRGRYGPTLDEEGYLWQRN